MSKQEKTQNKINSNKKKAIQYCLISFFRDWFQESITHTGIKKAVSWIIVKAKPSIPKTKLIFRESNQEKVVKNWNWLIKVLSKKNINEKA